MDNYKKGANCSVGVFFITYRNKTVEDFLLYLVTLPFLI